MTTVRELLTGSLRLISEAGEGQTPSAESLNDAFQALNEMIDSWTSGGGLIYNDTRETFSLIGGQASYTMGTGGDFNTTRPSVINEMFITSGEISYPVVLYDAAQYSVIESKQMGGLPYACYWDNNFALSTLTFHYVPDQNYSLTIYSSKPLARFASIDDVVNLPQGWERALRYNVAVAIAPEYEKEASQTVRRVATESLSNIHRAAQRKQNNIARVDVALQRMSQDIYNIYVGER